jgi:glucosylglycerate synthase
MSTLPMTDAAETQTAVGQAEAAAAPSLAICLPSMPSDALAHMVERLQQAFPGEALLIASPDQSEDVTFEGGPSRLVPYPVHRADIAWVLGAADYSAAARLAQERSLSGVLLLGAEAATLNVEALAGMRRALSNGVDLVVPRYRLDPEEGLVNSALLYPLTRALFGVDIRFPLPLDAGLSARMLNRLSGMATRSASSSADALIWPVAEASIAGFTVRQVEGAERSLPRPQEADLNILFPAVTSALFADLEAKATFWQRARTLPTGTAQAANGKPSNPADMEEIRALLESFRLAFSNLREIWSLVLPPQTLLSLKKLTLLSAENFLFPPNLWARTVYDFAMAFHLRTLNRGHLLGAMTPLYLAWVAGLLRESGGLGSSDALLEGTAKAFEQEKPYLVSRWRWPDRFNP